MEIKLFNFVLFLFLIFESQLSFAYKFIIVTDQVSKSKANDVIEIIQKTYPFNQFEMEFAIKQVPSNRLDCRITPDNITNLICHNTEAIADEATREGADQIFIVKDLDAYGGGGGPIPVISTHAQSTPRLILHEYMHALGLIDEYTYSESLTHYFCQNSWGNLLILAPNINGYSNDLDARTQHMGQIPWASEILESTKITHNNERDLGTDSSSVSTLSVVNETMYKTQLGSAVGLYKGKTCDNANPRLHSWKPDRETTIMDELVAGLGKGNEAIVMKALIAKGLVKKIIPPEPLPMAVDDTSRSKLKPNNPAQKIKIRSISK